MQHRWIDGAVHPEQIPDLTAYRLYLAAVSIPLNASETQRNIQSVHLRMIGMQPNDLQAMLAVLSSFYTRYHAAIDEYNREATAVNANGQEMDPAPLNRQLDSITQSTRGTLESILSADGWQRLDAMIQSQKSKMIIGVGEDTIQ